MSDKGNMSDISTMSDIINMSDISSMSDKWIMNPNKIRTILTSLKDLLASLLIICVFPTLVSPTTTTL